MSAASIIFSLVVGAAIGCRSDAPKGDPSGKGSAGSTSAGASPAPPHGVEIKLLQGAPSLAEVQGWWLVDERFKPRGDDPGARPGSAYLFELTSFRLVLRDASDKRKVVKEVVEADDLVVDYEGGELILTRRVGGMALRNAADDEIVPLRRATDGEAKGLDGRVAKLQKMFDRACSKALECCDAAKAKKLATDDDCKALIGLTDMQKCITSIAKQKRMAAEAKVVVPECLPDK